MDKNRKTKIEKKIKQIIKHLNEITINKIKNEHINEAAFRYYHNEVKINLIFLIAKFIYCYECQKLYDEIYQLHKNLFDNLELISAKKQTFESKCSYKYEDIHKFMQYDYNFEFYTLPYDIPVSNYIEIVDLSLPPIFSNNEIKKVVTYIKQQKLKEIDLFTPYEIKLIEDITIKRLYNFVIKKKNDNGILKIINKINTYKKKCE